MHEIGANIAKHAANREDTPKITTTKPAKFGHAAGMEEEIFSNLTRNCD